MELKRVNIINKGMSQDYSISKDNLEYAFKNKNVRIQALDDGTLLSITNVRGPKKITTTTTIEGIVVGKCYTGDYLVLFTCDKNRSGASPYYGGSTGQHLNYIYRIDIRRINSIKVDLLYKGYLGFELDRTFDTSFYYENANIQKVYWVESWYSEEQLKELKKLNPGYNYQNNPPRVINIITEGERLGKGLTIYEDNVFDFYPEINRIPKISVLKDRSIPSEHPAGVILYFITYYFDNGAETLIANNSSTFTIDHARKGAKADETGVCGFKLTLSNVDTKFDYARIYSATRTSKDGPVTARIVADIKINKDNPNTKYIVLDTGINQETIADAQLFFIGGSPLFAKTLEQKHDTLFLGNIKLNNIGVPVELKNAIDSRKIYYYKIKTQFGKTIIAPFKYTENSPTLYCTNLSTYKEVNGKIDKDSLLYEISLDSTNDAKFFDLCFINPEDFGIVIGNSDNLEFVDNLDIFFTIKGGNKTNNNLSNKYYKGITLIPNMFSSYYNYRLQTEKGSKGYKTFKAGELYRFGIQFQGKQGLWTDVVWLGDKECETYPIIDNENHQISLNNVVFKMPNTIKTMCQKLGFANYRIVMANPENQNGRRILAQGVVCPTLFSPGQRALGSSHSISSWIMRPKGMACSHHHFEPITSAFANKGAEIYGIDIGAPDLIDGVTKVVPDFYGKDQGSTHGGEWYTSPYYYTTVSGSTDSYDTSDAPKYLIIQMSVHSGHKLAMKATAVASEHMSNCLWNNLESKYDYIASNKSFSYDEDYGVGGWGKIQEELVKKFITNEWDPRDVLSEKALKKIARKQFWGEFLTIFTLVTAVLTAIGMTLTGLGASITIADTGILFMMIGLPGASIGLSSLGALLDSMPKGVTGKGKKDWQKEILDKGYIQLDTNSLNKQDKGKEVFGNGAGLLPIELASNGMNFGRKNDWKGDKNTINAIHFLKIVPLSGRAYRDIEVENEYNKFYIDESIVSFHSPDIENCRDKHLKFRIVGTAPINSIYSDIELKTSTPPYIDNGGIDNIKVASYRKILEDYSLNYNSSILSADYLYWDSQINSNSSGASLDEHYFISAAALYKNFLWDKSGSVTGGKKEMRIASETGEQIGENLPSMVASKTILNLLNSFGNNYFNDSNIDINYNPSEIKIFNGEVDTTVFQTKNNTILYNGNYDHLITYEKALTPHIEYGANAGLTPGESIFVAGPSCPHNVRIKYSSSPHAVFDLNILERSRKYLLPCVEGEVPYKIGNVNYKDNKTHIWEEGDDSRIQKVDTCWTSTLDWFYNDVYFKNLTSVNFAPTNASIFTFLERNLTVSDSVIIKNLCKIGKQAHIGICAFVPPTPITSASLVDELGEYINQLVLKGNIKRGVTTITYKGVTYTGNVLFFKYIIKDITLDSSGYITSIKGYFTTKYNDYVYVSGYDLSKGRFRWVTNNNSSDGCYPYIDFPIKYELPKIDSSYIDNYNYLFVGELYYDLKPSELYNGFNNIENLLWYPISRVTSIDNNVHETEGDTYYLRWDCLKTFPTTTENEVNKVVDITSFMVETHKNLDTRTDSNRDRYNIMSRPENFNLFNPVYDSVPNIFLYSVLRQYYNTTEFTNLITWSLKKNFNAKIDSWTNINISTKASSKNSITKIKNYKDTLFLLSEYSIDRINYDEKNFVATDSEFIELANNSKVDGIVLLYGVYGTHNQSTLVTEKGFYFIDDNESSIIRINVDGSVSKIAAGKMDSWFKNNMYIGTFTYSDLKPFHLEYDSVHKDIFIINKDYCLIYNENLEAFTSFMDYLDCYTLINTNGSLLAVSYDTTELHEMYEGLYNNTFNGVPIDYSIQYRVNPSPFNDKVFTNVEFIADCTENNVFNNLLTPFDDIHVWNEYQDTTNKPLTYIKNRPSSLKLKFRIWRADIPRDAGSSWGRDRIRNPWINMTLSKATGGKDFKLELHSMNVLYME